MLAGLRGTASLPLRGGPQVLYTHAVWATPFRLCCIAPTLRSHYSTRKPDTKDANRRSKQSDLDLSAFRESKSPEQKRDNSFQPRFRRDHNPDDGTRHDGKAQKLASERREAMLEHQHARRQLSEHRKECLAFCARSRARSLNGHDDTEELQGAREMTRLLATFRRLDLVRVKKLSTFAVAVIFAPVGAEGVTTANRLHLGLVLTLSKLLFPCSHAVSGILLIFLKRHVKVLESAEERNR